MRVTMTPEWSQELMAKNTNNRNLNKKLAQKYASDMKDGLWLYNGDAIRVSVSDVLLDGQHRLQGCIYAGVPFETELFTDLPDEVRPTLDTGRKRSAADVLHMLSGHAGRSNAGIAASCRQILNYVCGFAPVQSQSTPAIVRLLTKYPEISEYYRLASKCNGILTPGPLGAVLFLGTRSPTMEKRATSFVEAIQSGEGLQSGDPRLAVREMFINKRLQGAGARLPELTWCFIAQTRAWNAWATGQELERIRIAKNGDGSWSIPDVIGGPPRGEGLDSLANVRLNPAARRARAALEAADVGIAQ